MEIIQKTDYWVNNIKYYYYEANTGYSGSYKGMRYRISTNWGEQGLAIDLFDTKNAGYLEKTTLIVNSWPEPFCYDYTRKNRYEVISTIELPFTDEGLETARQWINNKYDERKREFDEARRQ